MSNLRQKIVFPQALVREYFSYRDDGILLWAKNKGKVKIGMAAHTKDPSGYIMCGFMGRYCKVHRLIWIWHYGDIPDGMLIDHLNGIKDDNRIDNLRLSTNALNSRNQCRSKRNVSGHNGVVWSKNENKWAARINVAPKVTKSLGYFTNKDDAIAVVKAHKLKHGYTERHGT